MPPGKSFIAGVANPVDQVLESYAGNDPSLRYIRDDKIIYRPVTSSNPSKVILLAGGGSGHEPGHAGYLGENSLDVVVSGENFASPSASQVLKGLMVQDAPQGTLMIIKNYTGDKLNFGLAAEKAKAQGKDVEMVIVGDDVSVPGNELVGRRGVAGVVFVHKVAGSKAAIPGSSLQEVAAVASHAASHMATAAASLDGCNVPGRPNREPLAAKEVEYGMGIHNEPGVHRQQLADLATTVKRLLDILFSPKPAAWSPQNGHRVAVMVNNLGGLSSLELGVISQEVFRQLAQRDVFVSRKLVGTFLTALDSPGFSVTLLQIDDELEGLLDMSTTAPAWPRSILTSSAPSGGQEPGRISTTKDTIKNPHQSTERYHVAKSTLRSIIKSIETTTARDEPLITKYDTLAGDGDCGHTLLNGVSGLIQAFKDSSAEHLGIGQIFRRAAIVAEQQMGGTSGALYAIFLNAVANAWYSLLDSSSAQTTQAMLLGASLKQALEKLCSYTPARIGHRTLMDALIPFVMTYDKSCSLDDAIKAAEKGAEGTRHLKAALGRASYVGQDRFDDQGGIPDPGALGVVSILRGVLGGLEKE